MKAIYGLSKYYNIVGVRCYGLSSLTRSLISLEHNYGAHNYHPIPVVLSKGKGVHVWDVDGKQYYDFLSAYSAVNQGHCHPKIMEAMSEQMDKMTLCSRAFHNDVLGKYTKFLTEYFGYEMVLPMNTGAEGIETAIKLVRKWGYMKKGIPENEAIVLACVGNFHGRTLGVISMSTDPSSRTGFGPYLPKVGPIVDEINGITLEYDNITSLMKILERYGKNVAGFLVEPIQGEAGVVIPKDGYLHQCFQLCKKHNILFVADEIQTGLGRTGNMLACDHEHIKPDVLVLGKALSGGTYPISAVLSSKDVMLCIQPGEHGSTYGGNPLACAIAMAALRVLKEEKLAENANHLGKKLLKELKTINNPMIHQVRGRGLFCAIEIDEKKSNKTAWDLCLLMKQRGLLAKPTHENIIRLAPPLVINEKQLDESIYIIRSAFNDIESINVNDLK